MALKHLFRLTLVLALSVALLPLHPTPAEAQEPGATVFSALDDATGEVVNFRLPPGWTGAYTPTDGFVFGNDAQPVSLDNINSVAAGDDPLPAGAQVLAVLGLPEDNGLIDPTAELLDSFEQIATLLAAQDDATMGEPVDLSTDRLTVIRGEYTATDGTDEAGALYLVELDGNVFIGVALAAPDAQDGFLGIADDILFSISLGEGEPPAAVPGPRGATEVTVFSAFDPTVDETLSFLLPLGWTGAYSADNGYVFANEVVGLTPANVDELAGGDDPIVDGGRAVLVIPLPSALAAQAGSSAAIFEQLIPSLTEGDTVVGETQELPTERENLSGVGASVTSEEENSGFFYIVEFEGNYFLLAGIAADDVLAGLETDMFSIIESITLGEIEVSDTPGMTATDIDAPDNELTASFTNSTGTFSLMTPADWVAETDGDYYASNDGALEAVIEFVAVETPGGVGFSVLTPDNFEDDFGGSALTTDASSGLAAVAAAFDLDTDEIVSYDELDYPAALIDATDILLEGNLAVMAVEYPGGLTMFAIQWEGDIADYEDTLIAIFNSVEVSLPTE